MDEQQLVDRLSELTPHDLDDARSRALLAARTRASADPTQRSVRRRPLKGPAIRLAAACLVILTAIAVTPPGRAATAWVGEQFGIGQPGGPASLRELREFALEPSGESGAPAYVMARGPVDATGGHYEIVRRFSKAEQRHCYELQLVKPTSLYGPACTPSPVDSQVTVDSLGSSGEVQTVSGRVGPDVDAIRVEFDGRPIRVQVTEVDAEIRSQLGIDDPLTFYFSSFTGFIGGGQLEISTLDGDGRVLTRQSRELFDRRPMLRMMCKRMREAIARTGRGQVDGSICPPSP